MIRICLSVVVAFISQFSFAQSGNPFSKLNADSVVIYDFSNVLEDGVNMWIINDNKLSPYVTKSVKLDKSSADHLTRLLNKKESYGGNAASCFNPHLGIVYYLKKEPVASISICMDCNKLESSLPLESLRVGENYGKDGPYYTGTGMSEAFRKEINNLLVRYHFSHQINGESVSDK